jgi:hypothetical protein
MKAIIGYLTLKSKPLNIEKSLGMSEGREKKGEHTRNKILIVVLSAQCSKRYFLSCCLGS